MATTIQIDEKTLLLLKKLKKDLMAKSYDDAITKLAIKSTKDKSIAGSLRKYYKNTAIKDIIKELQHERRKSDRF